MSIGDKIGNKAQELKGEAKEGLGRATGNREMEADGAGDKAEAGVRQAGENVKDAAKNIADGFSK